jgi:hypothetical protein
MPKSACGVIVVALEMMRNLERNQPSERMSCPLVVVSAVELEVAAVAEAAAVVGTTGSVAAGLGMMVQAVVDPEKRETEVSEEPEVVAAVVVAAQ